MVRFPSSDEKILGSLIDLVYEAGFDESKWSVFLKELESLACADSSILFLFNQNDPLTSIWVADNLPDQMSLEYDAYYKDRNILVDMGKKQGLFAPGSVTHSLQVMPFPELCKTEYYCCVAGPLTLGVSRLMS